MKFSSRFPLAAIAVAVAFTTISCTSQSPSAPVGANPTIEPGIGGTVERPAPSISPDDPIDLSWSVSLTGTPLDSILPPNSLVPFSVNCVPPCGDPGTPSMTIVQYTKNKQDHLTRVLGFVTFGGTGRQFSFSLQIKRSWDGAVDGGILEVCNPSTGACKSVRLPVLTRVHSGVSQPAI